MITKVVMQSMEWMDFGKEWRVIIDWDDEEGQSHKGCYYYTGNPYDPKGKMEDLTPEVLTEAIRLAVYPDAEGKMIWHTLMEDDCSDRYAELAATPPIELERLWTAFFEAARYTGS
jgi:hypothetical protein